MEPLGGGTPEDQGAGTASEMLRYSIDLRSIAHGRGKFLSEVIAL